jgi:hypothetical protein
MIVRSRLEGLARPHVHCFTPQNLGIEQEKNEVFLLSVSQMEALPITAIAVGRQKGGGGGGGRRSQIMQRRESLVLYNRSILLAILLASRLEGAKKGGLTSMYIFSFSGTRECVSSIVNLNLHLTVCRTLIHFRFL